MIVSAFIAALTVQILLTHTCNDEFQFVSQLGSTCHLTTTPSPHSINSLALGVVRLLQFYKIFYPPTLTPSRRICGLCASLVPRFQLGGGELFELRLGLYSSSPITVCRLVLVASQHYCRESWGCIRSPGRLNRLSPDRLLSRIV